MADRKGFDRAKFIEEIKENEELLKFVKELKKPEIERIKEIRRFETLKPDTNRFKVALLCDPLRQELRQAETTLMKRMWSMADLQTNIDRLREQLESGNITEEIKQGLIMNKAELQNLIQHNVWLQQGEFNALRIILGKISGMVGHIDYIKNVIISEEQFEQKVEEVKEYAKKYGYDLFGELND